MTKDPHDDVRVDSISELSSVILKETSLLCKRHGPDPQIRYVICAAFVMAAKTLEKTFPGFIEGLCSTLLGRKV